MNDINQEAVYVSAKDQSYNSYFESLKQYNLRSLARTRHALEKNMPFSGCKYTIIATGSDSRLERIPSSFSPMEIIVIANDPFFSIDLFEEALNNVINVHPLYVDKELEYKFLEKELIACYHGDKTRPFPTRIMDSVFLFGDEQSHKKAKQLLYEQHERKEGKDVLNRFSEKRRTHQKILLTGKQIFKGHDVSHYNLEEGIAVYNPKEYQLSFKAGPLRAIQYKIAEECLKYFRQLSPEDKTKSLITLENLPNNIVERIFALQAEGLSILPPEDISDLTDSYKYFLRMYGLSQELKTRTNESILEFDKKEVKQRLITLDILLKKKLFNHRNQLNI